MASATTGPTNSVYTATGELSATGNYTAGGNSVTNANSAGLTGTTAYWTPSASVQWTSFTSSGASAAGALSVGASVALSGDEVESAAGLAAVAMDVALSWSESASSAGTLTPETGVSVALSGEAVTSSSGTIVAGTGADYDYPVIGGWGTSYDRYLDRKREKRKREIELAEAEEAAQQLDAVDREIARLLHEQEKQDLERAESERLLRMARRYADSADVAEKVRAAMAKAAALETFGALEALKRELDRTAEEEEVALLLILNQ